MSFMMNVFYIFSFKSACYANERFEISPPGIKNCSHTTCREKFFLCFLNMVWMTNSNDLYRDLTMTRNATWFSPSIELYVAATFFWDENPIYFFLLNNLFKSSSSLPPPQPHYYWSIVYWFDATSTSRIFSFASVEPNGIDLAARTGN